MTINWGWVVAAALFAVLVYERNAESEAAQVLYRYDTVRVVDSVEVVRSVTRNRTLRDTLLLNVTDTLAVKAYVYQTDTLREKCMACIASASQVSTAGKAVIEAARPKFRDRLNVSLGYGITKIGPAVQAGPQLHVGFRIWP